LICRLIDRQVPCRSAPHALKSGRRGRRGEVIPAGKRSPRDPPLAPPIPTPQELGVEHGLGFASFADWVAMKLVANRDKDRYHLGEALRRATPDQVASVVQRLRALDPSYLREFERLLRAAEAENSDRW
jgi:hypothetical protein